MHVCSLWLLLIRVYTWFIDKSRFWHRFAREFYHLINILHDLYFTNYQEHAQFKKVFLIEWWKKLKRIIILPARFYYHTYNIRCVSYIAFTTYIPKRSQLRRFNFERVLRLMKVKLMHAPRIGFYYIVMNISKTEYV